MMYFLYIMETNNLLKLSEKMGLRELEDECIVLEDERADDIYGGKFVCFDGLSYVITGSKLGYCEVKVKF